MADSRTPRSSDGLGSASPAPAVTRAAAVLDALAASATGRLTLSDLARELGIPKSSTSNLLLALEEARLISRQGAEFTLGRKLVELGAAYLSRLDEVQEFYRFCEQAPTLSGETVRIAMLDGTNVIYLARYEGHPAVRLTSNIGDKMPVSLCAVGKALIARLHDHDIDAMFPDDARASGPDAEVAAHRRGAEGPAARRSANRATPSRMRNPPQAWSAWLSPCRPAAPTARALACPSPRSRRHTPRSRAPRWSRSSRSWPGPWATPWADAARSSGEPLRLQNEETSADHLLTVQLAVLCSI